MAAGGTWHAPYIVEGLARHRMLRYGVTTTPPRRFRRATSRSGRLVWNPVPELVGARMQGAFTALSGMWDAQYAHAVLFDRMLEAMLVARRPKLLVVFATFGLGCIRRMRSKGVPTVVERGSAHASERLKLLEEERGRLGLPSLGYSEKLLSRELAEYEAADYIMVPSTFARQSFVRQGVPDSKILEYGYGVDTQHFRPRRVQAGRRRILSVGNLGIDKGTHRLIEAYRELDDRTIELSLVGTLDEYCRDLLRRLPPELPVNVMGRCGYERMPEQYRNSALFVLTSLQEGQSMAVLEAMACGVPVIVSNYTGYEGVITEGQEGMFVRPWDAEGLADCIRTILNDEDSRVAMGHAARELAENRSWERYGSSISVRYREIVGGRDG